MSDNPTEEISAPDNTLDFNERRMMALSKENAQLREYVSTMMMRLHENDKLFSRLCDLESNVLAAGDPEDMCFTLLRELRSQFSLDMVRLWFDRDSIIGAATMHALSEHDLVWLEADEIKNMGLTRRNVWLLQMDKGTFPWLQERDKELGSLALLRLGSKEKPFGVIGIGSLDKDRFSPEQSTDFLQHLAQVITLSLEHAISHERLARLAITDALTGTHNRRFLQPYSHQPLSSWFGKSIPVAALFLDMDDFKGINDRIGHAAGDEALTELCNIIKRHTRIQDPLIRMGGDEFTLLLPTCGHEKATAIADKIIKDVNLMVCQDEHMSVSIGISCSSENEDLTLTKLIEKADKAMYVAKALGGNRAEFAQTKDTE
jgi:two-component system cell cycle response regulator